MITTNWKNISWLRLLLTLLTIATLAISYRYAFSRPWADLIKDLLPNLIAACIAVVVAWTLFDGISDNDRLMEKVVNSTEELIRREVEKTTAAVLDAVHRSAEAGRIVTPVTHRQIRDHLNSASTNVSEYRFLGNSGKHLSAVTLPHLAKVEAHSHEVSIWIQLLDPESSDALHRYSDDRKCSKDDAAADIYATILLACAWSRVNPRLRLQRISLRPTATHFRVDWSPNHCVITTEGKEDPGLALSNTGISPNHLHAKLRDQLMAAADTDRAIAIPHVFMDILPGTSTELISDEVFQTAFFQIAPANRHSAELTAAVLSALRKRVSPYG